MQRLISTLVFTFVVSVIYSAVGISYAQDYPRRVDRNAAATDTSALKDELTNLEKQSWEAWKKRDGGFFQSFLSDDHVEVGFYGSTNKARVVKGVASPACVVNSYAVDNFQLTLFDANTALLTYHAAQDTICGGNPVPSPVWATSLYLKKDGKWLNAFYEQTKDLRK